MNAAPRYAIYWTPPPAHPLWRAGCEWLGRDAADGSQHATPRAATATPRRYGFHATLKPPLRLRSGQAPDALLDAAHRLARETPAFAMPPLSVQTLADFVALRPAVPLDADHPLRRLADACVRALDPWRAPPAGDELLRRDAQRGLSPGQGELLQRWGYPHVFEHWRFHMTLSDSLPSDAPDDALRQQLLVEATRFFAAALELPLTCDALCVFVEATAGAPFMLAHRFMLEG
ncbi:DUF1045 domain-containing protein [Piscinibacter sp. XHJ-5]|uniref:DUF1045 domain-containing protein n=1 Tax=Piscinibacter sp. XHJ-5 TaxID=3037797 RepID=UPI00245282D5|nr:DUF1045 domain-containing protein [Piscinibacter sp. XHJ-5]